MRDAFSPFTPFTQKRICSSLFTNNICSRQTFTWPRAIFVGIQLIKYLWKKFFKKMVTELSQVDHSGSKSGLAVHRFHAHGKLSYGDQDETVFRSCLCALTQILVRFYTRVKKKFIWFSANSREQRASASSFPSRLSYDSSYSVCMKTWN